MPLNAAGAEPQIVNATTEGRRPSAHRAAEPLLQAQRGYDGAWSCQ